MSEETRVNDAFAESRQSLIYLLSNYACRVDQRGDSLLYCTCTGLAYTAFWGFGAVVCLLAMLNLAMLMTVASELSLSIGSGSLGVLLAAATSIIFAHLALRRHARHGRFEFDGDEGTLRRFRGRRLVDEFAFDDIQFITTRLDLTDSFRLRRPPQWLLVQLCNGDVLRIAKGDNQELAPVFDAIRQLGLKMDRR